MFEPVEGSVNFPSLEVEVGKFWRERSIYQKSLERRADGEPFVFYEGPPTANGMPHPGHCLTRAIKDVFPRYKTMRGYRCERKAGWDTHGLPVEVEVCKELGIHSKEEIEAYGIEPFIQKCQQSVWRYMQEWERLTERIGFWVDLEKAYVTYHQSYVESVWWSLKNLFDRGLLYQGHKIVWWWAQGGTALSAGEVGQGYREVADPSVYVKFPLLGDNGNVSDTSLLVWTTTPWTLPSNQFAAVHPKIEYATISLSAKEGNHREGTEERLIVAKDLVDVIAEKTKQVAVIHSICKGSDLVGKRYLPPFSCFYESTMWDTDELPESLVSDLESGDVDVDVLLAFLPGQNVEGHRQAYLVGPSDQLEHVAWRVVSADFVTTESGSGVVHQAPAFGEVDYEVLVKEHNRFADDKGPGLINCVGSDGKFTDEAPEFLRGRWVKEADKDIIRDLKSRGLLFHQEQYLHEYPFCWRAEQDPLIQYPRESWFIRTTAFKDRMLENNAQINWLPEHIKEGRFGKFLESNVDWALSRERYWGTPLPIWQCEETGKQEAVGGYDELLAKPGVTGTEVWDAAKQKNPELADDLRIHKPYIDAVTYDSPFAQGARMKRVPDVIDCWYDSGAMPFAQWGYRGEGPGAGGQGPGNGDSAAAQFKSQFPADFISEAIDQTRGWFYSQLAISTLLWSGDNDKSSGTAPLAPGPRGLAPVSYPHPFRNCIVLGLMLGEDGQKMSKQKRNYREPNEIFDKYGADALRWYLFANQPPWTSIRYSEQAIKDSIPEFLLRLWNCYSFFVIYANIDGFDPAEEVRGQGPGAGGVDEVGLGLERLDVAASYRPVGGRDELDRWVLSELARTVAMVTERMDAYDNFGACGAITEFVDALSNWYVRRSRDRFWAKEKRSTDKLDAYWTLYECLVTTSKLVAPFVPFMADALWRNLAGVFGDAVAESVHLCDFPKLDPTRVDEALSEQMALVRIVSSQGRRAREGASLKVRQPLAKVEVILADTTHQQWLESHAGMIAEELNVKEVHFTQESQKYVDYQVLPNFKLLGPKVGKLVPQVKQALGNADGAKLLADLKQQGRITLDVAGQSIELTEQEIEVRLTAKPGYAAASDKGVVVVLATELTPELVAEGVARDLIRAIQDRRKETGCEFTDRIEIGIESDDETVRQAVEKFGDYIAGETLADELRLGAISGVEGSELQLSEGRSHIYIRVK